MKVCIVLGTRPEIIKNSPLINELSERDIDFFVIHTGQHYSNELDKKIFEDLNISYPKYNLKIGSNSYSRQISDMIKKISEILKTECPDYVVVQGDTNSVISGAIAGCLNNIKVVHHEAGLRSGDIRMNEEVNRILTDRISDILFVPTKDALSNLEEEPLIDKKMFLVGNTIVDAIERNKKIADKKSDILTKLNVNKKYFLATIHRAENVDDHNRLKEIIKLFNELIKNYPDYDLVFPIHPRTRKMLDLFELGFDKEIKLINPVGYLDFIKLMSYSEIIITDSGGIQEEASILKIPCVTMRNSTERPETVRDGVNSIVDVSKDKFLKTIENYMNRKPTFNKLYGDGDSAKKIVDILSNEK